MKKKIETIKIFHRKLSKKTYDRIIQESHSEDAYKLGVQLLSAFVLSNKEECEVKSKDM